MTLTMVVIVLLIVIPGYFLSNYLARKFLFGDEKLERETENRYGFEKLEEKLRKEADKDHKTEKNNKN